MGRCQSCELESATLSLQCAVTGGGCTGRNSERNSGCTCSNRRAGPGRETVVPAGRAGETGREHYYNEEYARPRPGRSRLDNSRDGQAAGSDRDGRPGCGFMTGSPSMAQNHVDDSDTVNHIIMTRMKARAWVTQVPTVTY